MKELGNNDTLEAERKMRVLIAKDVLALLRQDKLIASPGTYLESNMRVPKSWLTRKTQVSAKLLQKPCNVCAMGAMFVAEVMRNDKLSFTQLNTQSLVRPGHELDVGRDVMDNRLMQFFSEDDLREIEGYFEGWGYHDRTVAFWCKSYPDSALRLRAIMKNIVRNNGDFKPKSQKTFLQERLIQRMRAIGMGRLLKSRPRVKSRKKPAVKGRS